MKKPTCETCAYSVECSEGKGDSAYRHCQYNPPPVSGEIVHVLSERFCAHHPDMVAWLSWDKRFTDTEKLMGVYRVPNELTAAMGYVEDTSHFSGWDRDKKPIWTTDPKFALLTKSEATVQRIIEGLDRSGINAACFTIEQLGDTSYEKTKV